MFLFVQWKEYFHLSPHENILTIALITIHYLYNIWLELPYWLLRSWHHVPYRLGFMPCVKEFTSTKGSGVGP